VCETHIHTHTLYWRFEFEFLFFSISNRDKIRKHPLITLRKKIVLDLI
jgi:hypothetical protein